jgi:hypothetical protein
MNDDEVQQSFWFVTRLQASDTGTTYTRKLLSIRKHYMFTFVFGVSTRALTKKKKIYDFHVASYFPE